MEDWITVSSLIEFSHVKSIEILEIFHIYDVLVKILDILLPHSIKR
jgi:hypothetical protein